MELTVEFPLRYNPQLEEELKQVLGSQYDSGIFIPASIRDCIWQFENDFDAVLARKKVANIATRYPELKISASEEMPEFDYPVIVGCGECGHELDTRYMEYCADCKLHYCGDCIQLADGSWTHACPAPAKR